MTAPIRLMLALMCLAGVVLVLTLEYFALTAQG